jgi:hypothetical protein
LNSYESDEMKLLEQTGRKIGFGRACQILGDQWDDHLEKDWGLPRGRGKMERRNDIEAIEAKIAAANAPPAAEPFQARVQPWMMACFGEMISGDREERNHRFLEEALELVQACGCTASEAHQLVDYVYGRDVGEKAQEVGGVMVTLAALCLAQGLGMHAAGETELARIWTKVDAIRAKQAAKPKYGPLPGVAPAAACGICNDFGAAFGKRCVCATEKNQIKSEGKAA